MVDPISIGVTVAVLAAKSLGKKAVEKASEKVGEQAGLAGWELGETILSKVRGLFSATDEEAEQQLETIETSESPSDDDVAELAKLIDDRLDAAPKVRDELVPLVAQANADSTLSPLLDQARSMVISAGGDITQAQQTAGNDATQIGRDQINIER